MRRSGFTIMARLIGLVRPLAGFMALAILLGLAGNLAATAITVLGGAGVLAVLDASGGVAEGFAAPYGLAGIIAAMAACALARGILRYGEQACNHFIAFKLLALIRDRVFRALRRLAPAKLEGRDRGDLISLITSDIELLEVFYAHTISPVAIAVLFCAVMVGFIGSYHPALGAIALAGYIAVGAVVPQVAAHMSGDAGRRVRGASGSLSGFVLDSLRGLDEILQYGAGAARLREMDGRTDRLAADEERLKRAGGRAAALTDAVILVFDGAMLACAAWLHGAGAVDFAGALMPVFALMGSFGPCVALANLGSQLQGTFAAGDRVLDILDEQPITADVVGCEPVAFEGAEARSVSFAYAGEEVLREVSVEAPRGAVVGIVGRSGSGKSTLLKLFMRFWETEHGAIEVSGRDINLVNTANLRDMEALVTQETQLFSDTIANNLRIAKLDATPAEIEAACRKASVHDFICSLPDGYDSQVGELGDTLSGGERQRLGLARAFLHDAPFMLLDEPTSNLDSLNEGVILRALAHERGERTVLLVSHRASTMRVADSVVHVEHGRVS